MSAAAFIVAAALVAYTFVGYPLLIVAAARVARRPVRPGRIRPRVAIVMVVHNGAAALERKLPELLAQDYPAERLRIVVASDGSTDGTARAARAIGDARVTLLEFACRRGKAACLNDAVAACDEDVIVFTDVRQRLHRSAVRRLVEVLGDERVAGVSGELVFERVRGFGEAMDAYWRYEKLLRCMESRVHSTVGATGALYALRRECYRPIPPDTILDDVLIPMSAVLEGWRVVFERRALAYDTPSHEAAQERVRKIRTLAGNFQLVARHPRWLLPWRNPVAFQFISHKVLRLLAPLALAVALFANIAVAGDSPVYAVTLALQLAAYAAALTGLAWPKSCALRPVRLASAFLSLNWFTVLGFVEFVSNPHPHLWRSA